MTETVEQLKQRAAQLQQNFYLQPTEQINAIVEATWRLILVDAPFALRLNEKALRLAVEQDYQRGRAFALRNIGWCQFAINLYKQAEQTLEASRKSFASLTLQENDSLASTLNGLAVAQQLSGNHEAALENYSTALRLYEKTPNKTQVAAVYNNLSTLYNRLGDYSMVLECCSQALPITIEARSPLSQARLYTSLGNVLWRINENELAIEILQQALVSFQQHQARSNESVAYVNLGAAHQSRREYERALENYWQSSEVAQAAGNLETQAEAWSRIGSVYLEQGDAKNAAAHCFKALQLSQSLGSRFRESETLLQIGEVYLQLNDFRSSEATLEQAAELSEKLYLRENSCKAHLILSQVYEKQNKLSAALAHYQAFHNLWREVNGEEAWRKIERLLLQKEFKKLRQASKQLTRRQASDAKVRRSDESSLSSHKLQQIVNFINQNLEENISVIELAEIASLNEKYFLSAFKHSTGKTPHQYVLEQRIKRSKMLLQTTRLPLIEIALRCGFSSQSHFTLQFRLMTGTTPHKFRQSF